MIGITTMNTPPMKFFFSLHRREPSTAENIRTPQKKCQHKGTQQTVIQFCRHGRLRTVDQRHIHTVYRCICGEPGQMHDAGGKACADGIRQEREERLTQICLVPVEDVSYLTGVQTVLKLHNAEQPRENKNAPR